MFLDAEEDRETVRIGMMRRFYFSLSVFSFTALNANQLDQVILLRVR